MLWPANRARFFSAQNSTTGNFTLSLGANNGSGQAAAATATLASGATALFYSDGVNVTTLLSTPQSLALPLSIANGGTGAASASAALFNLAFTTFARGYIGGLTLSNDSGSPNTFIDISAGTSVADDQSAMMATNAATKNLSAAWSAGSGSGALDSGSSLAINTWYHLFQIYNPTTTAVDFLASTSATAPALPSGFTAKRRIGAVRTDANAHLLPFKQLGETFLWLTDMLDANNVALSTSSSLQSLTVPTGVQVEALYRAEVANAGATAAAALFTSPDQNDQAVGSPPSLFQPPVTGAGGAAEFRTRTDTSGRIRVRGNINAGGYYIGTYGWVDTRGRFG